MVAQDTHLLIVAHGSRRAASNQEVEQLAAKLQAQAGSLFAKVSCAFLELAEPSIPAGIQQAIDAGAKTVVILPYFLSAGRHVTQDIPAAVAAAQAANPDAHLQIIDYLGALAGIAPLLLAHAQAHAAAQDTAPILSGYADKA